MYRFPLEENERIIKKDLANYECDGTTLTGAFYLTTQRLVFVGYLLDVTQKFIEEIPLSHVKEIRPEKTFRLIPNVLSITTISDRKVKILISKRDEWFMEIQNLLEEN